jgi:hypothetical protein
MRVSAIAGIVAVLFAFCAPQAARADQVTTQIINPPHSPAIIQRCQVDTTGNYGSPEAWVNIQNRTRHELITVDIQYSFYDTDKALFAQTPCNTRPEIRSHRPISNSSPAVSILSIRSRLTLPRTLRVA